LLVVAPIAIADGVLRLKRKQETMFFPILEFIAALLFITVGVIILVSINNAQNVVLIVIGAILCILALVEIAFTVKTLFKVKQRDKKEKDKAGQEEKKKIRKKDVIKPEVIDVEESFPVDKVE